LTYLLTKLILISFVSFFSYISFSCNTNDPTSFVSYFQVQSWRPSIEDPYKGSATWSGLNQQVLEFVVTLFEAQSFTGFEPKNWVFAVENVSV